MSSERYEDPAVAIAAKELATHTLKLTANTNNFPKKYRMTIVNGLVELSLGLYENIIDANNATGETRIRYQTAAISKCRKMRGYLEITLQALHPACSISNWCRMVNQIETQLLNWRRYTTTGKRR